MIRKPAAAERESSVRRAAEVAVEGGRILHNASVRAPRGISRGVLPLMLVMFTFGALTASSFGAKILGLAIMAPFWFFAWRYWKADRHS